MTEPAYYVLVQRQDSDLVARLACATLKEAQLVRQSFVNWGRCSSVDIVCNEITV